MIPRLGVTLGDPAGIGPEVIVRALARRDVRAACRPVVIGDRGILESAAARLKERVALRTVTEDTLLDGAGGRGARFVDLLPVSELSARACRPGRPSIEGGRASYRYIEAATRLAQRGAIDAIVTAPINKAAVTRAGFPISGHTELLRELTGAREVRMMLAGDKLRVVLVTMHIALADVS
ncbi:MAG TPA: 4-hydroxythreonine-4-phosphate dehydrogenase PdxA, partial [Candidatus Binatia bacterium]